MTLNDIIVSALAQLDRGHDAQSLDVWRDKFTRFANDGVTDICATYKHGAQRLSTPGTARLPPQCCRGAAARC